MELRPGYKQTEVGVIPEEWEPMPLAQMSAFITKGSTPTTYGFQWERIGVLFLRSECVSDDGLDLAQSMFISQAAHSVLRRSEVHDGDILITITGNVGRVVHLAGIGQANLNQHIARIRITAPNANVGFVSYYLSQSEVRKRFGSITTGQAYPQLSLQQVRDAIVPLPPLPEQRTIAGALGDVDALLGALARLIAKKRDLKQAAMQQLLTGHTRLPGFSGEWEVKRLGDVIELIPAGIYGEDKPRDCTVPCRMATTAHIDENDTWNSKEMALRYFLPDQIRRYSPKDGDLIVVKSSGSAEKIQSGKIGFVDAERAGTFLFSNFLMLLRPISIVPRFLYFYLCSYNVKKLLPMLVEASTYPNIRIDEYLSLNIPTPKTEEQTAIAAVLSDMDAELAALEARLAKTRALKQGMMQELLTGKTRLV